MNLYKWDKKTAPSLEDLRTALVREGFWVSEWADLPGTVYPVHTPGVIEARWVVRGQLRIGLENGEEITLHAGDRLDLDPDTPYWADVDGEQPVMYLIGVKNGRQGDIRS